MQGKSLTGFVLKTSLVLVKELGSSETLNRRLARARTAQGRSAYDGARGHGKQQPELDGASSIRKLPARPAERKRRDASFHEARVPEIARPERARKLDSLTLNPAVPP